MPALARWCLRHRLPVLAAWVVALVATFALSTSAGTAYSSKFQLPNTPSTQALHILQADFPTASGEADQIVLQATHGTITSGAAAAAAKAMLVRVSRQPDVVSVTSPYGAAGRLQVSRDGVVAFATVTFNQTVQTLPDASVLDVIHTAQAGAGPDLKVALSGQAISNVQSQKTSSSTVLGVVMAMLVLFFAFGALFAAIVPLLTALIAIGIGFSVTGLLSHVMSIASFAPVLGVLIGLGVGVDYALFILTRHRNGLRAGRSVEDSAANAVNTAGRAVFFAGITVCIALLGQFALGVSFLYGVAIASTVTVALTMAAALTLLPAFLGFFGVRVLSRKERRSLLTDGPREERASTGFWYRWARSIEGGAALRAVASLLVVVVVALPVFTLRLGLTDAGSDPPASTTRQAYDMLAKGFGPGFSGPFQLVATLPKPGDVTVLAHVVRAAAAEADVAAVTAPRVSPNGRAAVAILYPASTPQAKSTTSLLYRLRDALVPSVTAGTGVNVLIGGTTAGQEDFAHVLSSKLPQFVAVVVVLAFLLLMVVFRSLLIPAIASVMNLLSVGAALGVMNAVFSWGWGASLLGLSRTGPVEVFIPVIMFSVLFGLSMDYEVFLVSRMHEEWTRTGDNRRAVTTGQTETGRVITAAALIMILVFLSFLLGGQVIIEQFGVGLAAAILIDAFVVRTVLVPSLMHLFGRANWWLPGWLERGLPHLAVDVPDGPPPVGAESEPVATH